MALDLNEDVNPYYNDYSPNSNYYQVLFQPQVPVQARELTTLQSILQDQIEKFGDNIFVEGTVIAGCNFIYDPQYFYIKVPDLALNGQPVQVESYPNTLAICATSNLQALVVDCVPGFQSQNPDLNTLYVKYQNSGTSGQTQFSPGDTLTFWDTTNNTQFTSYTLQVAPATLNGVNTNPVGIGYAFRVTEGVIYQKGFFIQIEDTLSVIVDKYSNQPDGVSVGFTTSEEIITYLQDPSLLDNASGFSNFNAPGADRLKLVPGLIIANTANTPNSNFLTLVQWQDGSAIRSNQQTVYNSIGQELARRTYEESGNYVVNPFTFTTEAANTTYFNGAISSGLAYVEGYRVENLNTIRVPFRRGIDTKTATSQVLSTNFGSYVYVDQYLGNFNFQNGVTVSLRDNALTSVSSQVAVPVSSGSNEIGQARLLGVNYDNGLEGTANCQYRMYLTNITMNSGKNFANVEAIFYSGSVNGVADIVLTSNAAVLQDSNISSLVIDTSKIAANNISNTNYTYRYSTLGTSLNFTTSGTLSNYSLGVGSQFPYGSGQLDNTTEGDIVVIPTNAANVALTKSGTVAVNTGVVVGTGTNFLSEYNLYDWININGTDRQIVNIVNSSYLTLSGTISPNVVAGNSHSKYYPAYVPIPFGNRNSYITLPNTSTMTLQLVAANGLAETLSANLNVILYHDIQKNGATAITKAVYHNQIVNIDTALGATGNGTITSNTSNTSIIGTNTSFAANLIVNQILYDNSNNLIGTIQSVTNNTFLTLTSNAAELVTNVAFLYSGQNSVGPNGPFSLGLPDVLKLNNVGLSYGNTFIASAGVGNITNYFQLNTGQKDGYYDLASINLTTAARGHIPNGAKLIVSFDVFNSQSGAGYYYYNINSYQSAIANGDILVTDIPIYTSSTGQKFDLRNCFDFRPQLSNTAILTSNTSNATINPSNTSNFSGGATFIPSPDQLFNYDITYYLGRIDTLNLNSLGSFVVNEGVSADIPAPPNPINNVMQLVTVNIPPYPSLSSAEATKIQRPDYTISSAVAQTIRYTMADIGELDARLKVVEYYSALNLLEQEMSDLVITSSVTGNQVFKNGIFAETFQNQNFADTGDIQFRIGYDPSEPSIIPSFQQNRIDLEYANGATLATNRIVTMNYSETAMLVQSNATRSRNCTNQLWDFVGEAYCFPPYDCYIDTVVSPVVVPTPSPTPTPTPPPGNIIVANTVAVPANNVITYPPPAVNTPQYYQGQLEIRFFKTMVAPPATPLTNVVLDTIDTLPTIQFPTLNAATGNWPLFNKLYNIAAYGLNSVTVPRGVSWHGQILVPNTGTYTFHITHNDAARLDVNKTEVIGMWQLQNLGTTTSTESNSISLTAGTYYQIDIDWFMSGLGNSQFLLTVTPPGGSQMAIPTGWFYRDLTPIVPIGSAGVGVVGWGTTSLPPVTTSETSPSIVDQGYPT